MNPRIHQLHQPQPLPHHTKAKQSQEASFKEAFNEAKSNALQVSKHAQERLRDRNINIDNQKWKQISSKMSEAKSKGVTDSLVLLKDAALVVSTKNNMVVTAMNKEDTNSHIFTNINGTIILDD
ncbi:TIGR02530 family flagellar biosynthesis protein [Halobacillus seohaensis]|uniref:TIGR02530 family flagellar biosynthesis protein n=1 Tax=Halobacillus seohaensis TaxID=447421 RepID=A0ABW2EI67_9BACI